MDVLVRGSPAARALRKRVGDALDEGPHLPAALLAVLLGPPDLGLRVPLLALDAAALHVRAKLVALPGPLLAVQEGSQRQPLALADALDGRRRLGLPDEEGAAAVGGHLDRRAAVGGRDGGEVSGGLQDGDTVRVDPGAGPAGPGDPAGGAVGVPDQLPCYRPADNLGVLARPAEGLRLLLAVGAHPPGLGRSGPFSPFSPVRGLLGRVDGLGRVRQDFGRFGRFRPFLGQHGGGGVWGRGRADHARDVPRPQGARSVHGVGPCGLSSVSGQVDVRAADAGDAELSGAAGHDGLDDAAPVLALLDVQADGTVDLLSGEDDLSVYVVHESVRAAVVGGAQFLDDPAAEAVDVLRDAPGCLLGVVLDAQVTAADVGGVGDVPHVDGPGLALLALAVAGGLDPPQARGGGLLHEFPLARPALDGHEVARAEAVPRVGLSGGLPDGGLLVGLDGGGLADALAGAVVDAGEHPVAAVADGHGEGVAAQLGGLLDPVGVRRDDLFCAPVEQDHVRVAALSADVVAGDAEVLAAALVQADGAQGAGDGDGCGARGGDEGHGAPSGDDAVRAHGVPPWSRIALQVQSMRTQ
ncbi:hypothetical protein [Streptomyces sp. NPDC088847]|uniref:hypothetical protein n=1 Tax=Streptomyces sp. NPDC088847 TaxID=3365909 RepID=UPI00380B84D3